jgi:hypothetical protein
MILPQMAEVSNNSQLTNIVCNTLCEKLTPKEFQEFRRWLQIVSENKRRSKRNLIQYWPVR